MRRTARKFKWIVVICKLYDFIIMWNTFQCAVIVAGFHFLSLSIFSSLWSRCLFNCSRLSAVYVFVAILAWPVWASTGCVSLFDSEWCWSGVGQFCSQDTHIVCTAYIDSIPCARANEDNKRVSSLWGWTTNWSLYQYGQVYSFVPSNCSF